MYKTFKWSWFIVMVYVHFKTCIFKMCSRIYPSKKFHINCLVALIHLLILCPFFSASDVVDRNCMPLCDVLSKTWRLNFLTNNKQHFRYFKSMFLKTESINTSLEILRRRNKNIANLSHKVILLLKFYYSASSFIFMKFFLDEKW